MKHVVTISSRRDRTEINSAMLEALLELFDPSHLKIFRCYANRKKAMVFTCAEYGPDGRILRNAYLPDPRYCSSIERKPLLNRCRKEMSPVLDTQSDGTHRIVFPVILHHEPAYLIDLTLVDQFHADHRILLMGLIEYFNHHIALLDYGESDTLTGLANRKTFEKHLFELLGNAAADPQPGHQDDAPKRRQGNPESASHWIAVCDIDHFKRINDTHGHLLGDEVLVRFAQLMRQSFRFNDQLFRFGGEEFVALLQPTDAESARTVLERFRSSVEQHEFSGIGKATLSIGFSRLQPNDTPAEAIERADEALYFAKLNGRNRVDYFEELLQTGKVAAREIVAGEIELF